ncbi:putative DNA binding domain-containing protein [Candidatus Woesearchaeota archaeon]|nr:MAG: divergent AAA ATP [archaeon GW2011_AR4]MBS3129676.1 putative DNA binding domain-containing protein [Candidatus Woesearchaeota archaeon]HIH38780.1 HTH domain-containing protein [Candidatus Woesearchaeota archaeon]HIH49196.1 HTH domain-containing protein [Candidatus Woesearchaeota archaeon]HIJ03338.1 HTH domain-containing protein [Candidatus Woesearchaeota archaeon]
MNKKELIRRLDDIEWEDFEVKLAKSEIPKSSWETVSAFSNTAGGWLVFGINKKGSFFEIEGVASPTKIEQDFTTLLRNRTKFNKIIEVVCKKYTFPEGVVLGFNIPQKSPRDKPVYFDNPKNTFIRTGSGDQRATQEEIDSFFRNSSFEEKDKEISTLMLKDLDHESIMKYRNLFTQMNPSHPYNSLKLDEFLQKLRVHDNGKVTYGGLLLFGTPDSLLSQFNNFRIEYLEIPGTSYHDATTRYDYRISSKKNLFSSYFEISQRLFQKVSVPFSIRGGFRNDDPEQLQAIREALVNLIMHTDYFSSGNACIRVFSDKFEFFNPGALPKKIELILKEDYSQPRNPIVARAFRFAKLSENIGSGFTKMFSGWKRTFGVPPFVEGDFDHYKITFPLRKPTIITTNKTTNKPTIKRDIIELLSNNPSYTGEDIAKALRVNANTVRFHIQQLKSEGKLARMGSKKKGYWKVM